MYKFNKIVFQLDTYLYKAHLKAEHPLSLNLGRNVVTFLVKV